MTGETPAALWSKDYHSLWVNTAGLARAGGDLDVDGGVVERDGSGEPTGVLREESAWRFRDRHVVVSEDELVDATRAGIKLANQRGVAAIHDKDGWLGAHAIFARSTAATASRSGSGSRSRTSTWASSQSSGSGPASAMTTCAWATSRHSWTGRSAPRRP